MSSNSSQELPSLQWFTSCSQRSRESRGSLEKARYSSMMPLTAYSMRLIPTGLEEFLSRSSLLDLIFFVLTTEHQICSKEGPSLMLPSRTQLDMWGKMHRFKSSRRLSLCKSQLSHKLSLHKWKLQSRLWELTLQASRMTEWTSKSKERLRLKGRGGLPRTHWAQWRDKISSELKLRRKRRKRLCLELRLWTVCKKSPISPQPVTNNSNQW